ncbi:MAG TPA: hypothetical protein VM580_00780 [Labilithrix sp.]|nr:hypothetical protein [Labilithrix sp.]
MASSTESSRGSEIGTSMSNPPTMPGADTSATPKTTAHSRHERAERIKEGLERSIERISAAVERPIIGAGVAGLLVAAAAGMWGPSEALLGAAAGLLAYRALKKRRRAAQPQVKEEEPPSQHPSAVPIG